MIVLKLRNSQEHKLFMAKHDKTVGWIVGRNSHGHSIPNDDADIKLAHFATELGFNFHIIF